MTYSIDRFLSEFYRAQERRESPRVCSAEARSPGGFEEAQHAESAYLWALCIMGTIDRALSPNHRACLRHYYLHLSNAHVALFARQRGGQTVSVARSRVEVGCSPEVAADLQSFCDFDLMARTLGLPSGADARANYWEARAIAAAELDRRAPLSGVHGVSN